MSPAGGLVSALYGDEGGKDSERINFDEITKISRQLHKKLDDQVDDKSSETHFVSLQVAPEVQKPISLVVILLLAEVEPKVWCNGFGPKTSNMRLIVNLDLKDF